MGVYTRVLAALTCGAGGPMEDWALGDGSKPKSAPTYVLPGVGKTYVGAENGLGMRKAPHCCGAFRGTAGVASLT